MGQICHISSNANDIFHYFSSNALHLLIELVFKYLYISDG